MNKKEWGKLAFTSLLGVGLANTFVFLAALPIRYLRLTFGRSIFLATSVLAVATLAAFQLWQWAWVYLSVTLLIGFYRELEERQFSIFPSATVAVTGTAGTNLLALFIYSQWTGVKLTQLISEKTKPMLEQLKDLDRFNQADIAQAIWYLPSGLIITLMVILFVSLSLSRVPGSLAHRMQMRMFKLPDALIWVFIGSLAGSFLDLGSFWVMQISKNVLAITCAAYFFQGLAVFTYFLDRLRIFGLWRLLAYFLVLFQMFIFISGLGILDFWFDFRMKGLKEDSNEV